jgi:hypothetical protein
MELLAFHSLTLFLYLTKMKIFRFLILFSICFESIGANIAVKNIVDKKNSICFSWIYFNPNLTTVSIRIYAVEGRSTVFPSKLADTLLGAATEWCSTERAGVDIFGMDVKSPEQWGDPRVFTRGEVYTVGIERIFVNQRTQKNESEKIFFYVYPYRSIKSLPIGVDTIRSVDFSLTMPDSYRTFISRENNVLIFLFPKRNEPIMCVYQKGSSYILKLKHSGYIEIDKKPKRPEPLGNPLQVYTTLSVIFGSLLLVSLIVIMFAMFKSLYYLNFLFGNISEARQIFSHIVATERFFSVIIFFICLVVKFDILSKLVKHFSGLEIALFKSDPAFAPLVDQIMNVLRSHSVSDQLGIKDELNTLVN